MKRIWSMLLILVLIIQLCGCDDSASDNAESMTESPTQTVTTEGRLPKVKYYTRDRNTQFCDIVNLTNGGFAVAGCRNGSYSSESLIRICDENAAVLGEYLFQNGNGFDKITACSDGGFIAASYLPACVTKIDENFETEWFKPYEDYSFEGLVQDIEEINPNCYAVLFVSSPYYLKRLKISFLDKNGSLIETVDLMKNIDPSDADIIPDGTGGFYLISACNKSLAENFALVKENYDDTDAIVKASEVIIMHFSADRELIWVNTLGGGGNDWVEESAMDSDGNIYIAVGTNWYGVDEFWDMSVERERPFRRMLVKLDKKGKLVYKIPLSDKGLEVDQVFAIHIKNKLVYVVGMANYLDGYQIKYPCEQIPLSEIEKDEPIYTVYTACFDSNGTELDRRIFRCDQSDIPCDSTFLSNGNIVIASRVSSVCNPFELSIPWGVRSLPSLFIYDSY